MKNIVYLFLTLFLVFSCTKGGRFDDKLSLNRQDNNSNKLRIDGYYYNLINGKNYDVFCFYENGIIQYIGGGVDNFDDFENHIQTSTFIIEQKKHKYNWGCYVLNNNEIHFELWYASSGGPLKSYVKSGIILNDTTFMINKSKRSNGSEETSENETYYFKKFTQKPDSTNNYIK